MSGPLIAFIFGCAFLVIGGWMARGYYDEFSLKIRPLWVSLVDAFVSLAWIGFGVVLIVAAIEGRQP